jgi:hypothetical protein
MKNVETSNPTTRLDLLTYYLTMKDVINRVGGITICIVDLTRKYKGKYSRGNLGFLHFYNFSTENAK